MQLIPVHANKSELMYLDILQGGPSFDDQFQIREYSKLESLFRDPEFLQMIMDVLGQISETGNVDHQFERLRAALKDEPIEFVDAPGDSSPEIAELSALGENGGDDKIALFPPAVIAVFKDLVGDKINAKTGMNQFFFPIVAAIFAGAAASAAGAGLLGTAVATGLGSFAANKLMGAKTSDALRSAGLSALGSAFMPMIGQGFTQAFPEAAKTLGNFSTNLIGEGATNSLAAALTGTGPQYAADLAKTAAEAGTGAAARAAAGSAAGAASAAASGATNSLLSGNLPLLALGGSYMFDRANQQQKQYEKERDAYNKSDFLNSSFEIRPYSLEKYKSNFNPEKNNYLYDSAGKFAYRKGGLVDGASKGQLDNRPLKLKEGSYVVNATALSDLGDGNTKAGNREVDKFISKIKKNNDGHKKKIDVMLSDGERVIDRNVVTALGNGSNEAGAKLLDRAFKKLRSHKISKGTELPPPAFKLEKYIFS